MIINVKLEDGAIFKSNNPTDVGYDICAWQLGQFKKIDGKRKFMPIDNDSIILKPLDRVAIDTGISAEWDFETGYNDVVIDTKILGRSGLNSDGLLCQLGTIDETYRGKVFAVLINVSNEDIEIKQYEKIAQIGIGVALKPKVNIVNVINKSTNRGDSGFGSSGK